MNEGGFGLPRTLLEANMVYKPGIDGTTRDAFQVGRRGPHIKKVSDTKAAIRDRADAALARLEGLDPVDDQDFITKIWALANVLPDAPAVFGTSTITRTLSTYALMSGMTITPPSGTYIAIFSSTIGINKNSRSALIAIHKGGTIQQETEREVGGQANNQQGLTCLGKIAVNGSEALEVQWRLSSVASSPTATAKERGFILLKVAP